MEGQINGLTDEQMNRWMESYSNAQMNNGWADRQIDKRLHYIWIDGYTDIQMNRWADAWTDRQNCVFII
jgi:hypothetical protein